MVLLDVVVKDKNYRFCKWYKEDDALKLLKAIYFTYPHHPLLVIHKMYSPSTTPQQVYEIDIAFNNQYYQVKNADIWNIVPIKYKEKRTIRDIESKN